MSATVELSAPSGTATIAQLLAAAVVRLRDHSESPRVDAELLLGALLDCGRAQLLARDDRSVAPPLSAVFMQQVERRASGEPVAYLLGVKDFWSLRLRVSPAVLVPRPETELLVEWSLELLRLLDAPAVADLGTGSGAIALALAQECGQARVVAIDACAEALAVAHGNAQALGLSRVEFRRGDWLAPLSGERYDLIVSNPPYIAAGDPHLAGLQSEPPSALVSGVDGLDAIRRIVEDAPACLQPGGWLLLEHGAGQGALVRSLLVQRGFAAIATRCDLAGLERATGGGWPGSSG